MNTPRVSRYVLPVVLVAGALLPTLALNPLLERSTFMLFLGAVVLSALFGGLAAGLLAAAWSVAAVLLFVELPPSRGTLVRLATFVIAAVWISVVSDRTRRFSQHMDEQSRALGRSEERYRRIVDLADEGVWALDAGGGTLYVNRRLEQMLGASPGRLQGRSFFEIVASSARDKAHRAWERVRAGETVREELPLTREDGETVDVRVAGTPRMEGSVFDGAVAMLTDLTEHKRAQETLVQSESLLRSVIDGTGDSVMVNDRDGRYLLINPAGARAFGRTPESMVGRRDAELMPPALAAAMEGPHRRILDEGVAVPFEYTLGEGPEARSFSAIGAPYRDGHGAIVGVLAIARDITERERVEAEKTALLAETERARREAEAANRAKDEFLATLSHELRTPLTSIVGWAKMLRSGQLDSDTTARAIETIDRNARVQTQLIADVLDLSRIVSGKLRLSPRPMDVAPVVEAALDTVRPAAEAKGISLHPQLELYPCTVSGDPDRLQQVVWNLLSNAIKFTPRGGAVDVRLGCRGAEAEIEVQDTGIGIADDLLPHVFERFRQGDASSTRSYGGLGLGLAIVRHVVELHGGRVEAESAGPGQGATFRVRLPLLVPALGAAPEVDRRRASVTALPTPPTPALHGLKVLVVDDEADSRELVREILTHAGADVHVADSAARALDELPGFHPDVLLSDIEMPGESGYGLIRTVRQRPAQEGGRVPAAALTAYARLEDRTRALRAGFQMHVPKPLNPNELVTIVASLAGRLQEAT
jgi:PAS domain S-box-containing protein